MNNDITLIYAPELPESVVNATILNWHKKQGDKIKRDEVLIDIETDKIIIEVAAPSKGILHVILKNKGEKVSSKEILGKIISENIKHHQKKTNYNNLFEKTNEQLTSTKTLSPKLRRLAKINSLTIKKTNIKPIDEKNINFDKNYNTNTLCNNISLEKSNNNLTRTFEKIPMTSLRKCIANRLTYATNSMAMLTTFNEVNMQYIIDLKNKYGNVFEEKHQIKLGITSFFVKAMVEALKIFPKINASIDNEDIIYYKYFDVSIAMSTNRGLVTPVLKNVESMNILDIERNIKNFKLKSNNGKLSIEELTGGNITITNGGVFGSLMSTPIVNPPQTAILGLHSIKKRPMVVNEEIKILPMMYLALSYDHRLIDGYEAISFLIKIKDYIEDFSRIMLDV